TTGHLIAPIVSLQDLSVNRVTAVDNGNHGGSVALVAVDSMTIIGNGNGQSFDAQGSSVGGRIDVLSLSGNLETIGGAELNASGGNYGGSIFVAAPQSTVSLGSSLVAEGTLRGGNIVVASG